MSVKNYLHKLYDIMVQDTPLLEYFLLPVRSKIVESNYLKLREYYNQIASYKNLIYSENYSTELVKKNFIARNYIPPKKTMGDIRTFAFIPNITWHRHLLNDLNKLGPIYHFDYTEYGYDWNNLFKQKTTKMLDSMNEIAFKVIEDEHKKNYIDWVFFYASGHELSPLLVKKIKQKLKIPTVLMCLDDKQSWITGKFRNGHRKGQVDLANVCDLSWTTSKVTCLWYLAEGGIPIFLPEGCNNEIFFPLGKNKEIDVVFIGERYGFRSDLFRFLQKYNIHVKTYGKGWDNGFVSDEKMNEIYSKSKIVLSSGGIRYSEDLTNIKGRDFDVPCAGGGLYITSYNPDLSDFFNIGKEIVCFRTRNELIELIRYYLKHQNEAANIVKAGRAKCLKEHLWMHRYIKICKKLNILDEIN